MPKILAFFKQTLQKNTLIIALCAVVLGGSSLGLAAAPAYAACDNNYIVRCGVSSAADLNTAYKGDVYIQHVYSYFGISSSDVASMSHISQAGTVNTKGEVIVGGKVVATKAITAGRQFISGSTKVTYKGSTFYTRPPSVSFRESSLNAWVVMQNGQFAFAVLPSCGNPIKATPVPKPKPQPFAVCKALTVSQKGNDITAHVTSTLQNGATYKTTTYNFGDTNTLTTANTTVTHHYAKAGTYLITAQQTFSTGKEKTIQKSCQKTITITAKITPPPTTPTTPATPTTPTPPPTTPVSAPTPPRPQELVNTGAGSIGSLAGIFAATTVAGTAFYRFRLTRKLQD